LTSDNDRRYCI